jgi:hypothetical protein
MFFRQRKAFSRKKRFSIKFERRFVESRNLNLYVVFYPTLVQSVFSVREVQPIRWLPSPTLVQSGFFGAGSSAHQVLLLSHTGPIRFFRIGSSCNRVIFYWESNQSGNFAVRLSSSQAFQAGSSVNRGLCGCDIRHSGFFLGKRSANQVSWA